MIYTFYSYKGGVGRSMAVANIAEWFYQQGLRVLIVDWDLEAPGIESFFVEGDEIEKVRGRPGLLDMLLAYKDQYPLLPMTVRSNSPEPAVTEAANISTVFVEAGFQPLGDSDQRPILSEQNGASQSSLLTELDQLQSPTVLDTHSAVKVLEENLSPLTHYLYPLRPPKLTASGNNPALWLLSAGWRTKDRFADYGREVQNFSWSEFYDTYHGEAYFEWMRKQLNSTEMADVVLIDSRTGLTEMGGVSTRQLADVVVSFTAPNIQNLTGVAAMIASFKRKEVIEARNRLEPGRKRPLEVIVVPTRLENSELEARADFKSEFTKNFNEYPASFRILKRTFWDLAIPYISKYAYREKLAVGDERGSEELQAAYKTLAAHLVLLAPEASVIRVHFADELRRVFGKTFPRVLLRDVPDDSDRYTHRLREELTKAGLSLWDSTEHSDGTDISRTLSGDINLAEFLVLPVTRNGARSAAFQKQWQYARQQGVCVQLIRNPDDELAEADLPLWLRDAHIFHPVWELDALVEILKRPCITSRVPFMVPDLPESYVRRTQEIKRLSAALLDSAAGVSSNERTSDDDQPNTNKRQKSVARVAVCGPPGCGKTVLAEAVCHDEAVIAAFFEGILWVTLGDGIDAEGAIALIYHALTGESPDPRYGGLEQMLASKLSGKKCLMVVNDVYSGKDLSRLIDLLSTGAVLFTTTDQSLARELDAVQLLLEPMTSGEALELLVKQSRISPGQEEILRGIVDLMGRLPLPVKLAGAALRERLSDGEPHTAVVDLYTELQAKGVVAFDKKAESTTDLSLVRSITASLDRLAENQRKYFLMLSLLPPETDVPLHILKTIWEQDEAEMVELASRFHSLSLLHYDPVKRSVRISQVMHSFLEAQQADPSILNAKIEQAEQVFSTLTPLEQAMVPRVMARLVHVSGYRDPLPDTSRHYDLEQFDAAAKPVVETLRKSGLITLETANQKSTVQLADNSLLQWNRMREWLDADRPFLNWRQTLETNIAEWESSKRHNHEVLLKGKGLAEARTWLNKNKDNLSESERLFITESEHLDAKRKRSSRIAASVILLAILATLASVAYLQVRTRRTALESLKSMSDTRVALNTDPLMPPDEASYQKAIEAYNKVIGENPGFAQAYGGRASAYTALGNYDQAINDYQDAIRLDPQSAEFWKDLGLAYKLKGDKSDAAVRGTSDPQKIKSLNQATKVSYEQAIGAFNRAINFRPDYVEAYFGRGDTYTSKGDKVDKDDKSSYDLAIADYSRVIAQLQRDNPSAEAYYKRGLAYRSKGDYTNALADFQKASDLPGDVVTRENIRKNLEQLVATGPPVLTPSKPNLFIQYNDPDDEDEIKEVAEYLKANDYTVVGRPQLSAGSAVGNGDVRCFSRNDLPDAQKIADLVQESLKKQEYDKTIIARDLKGYPNVPPKQIEIWIASLRLSKSSPSEDSSQHPNEP